MYRSRRISLSLTIAGALLSSLHAAPDPATTSASPPMETTPAAPSIEKLLPKAEAGDAAAQFELGNLYDAPDNSSSAESCQQALVWYERAAAQSYPKAAEHAGYLLLHGLTGKTDHARALKWLRPVAEGGSSWASEMIATSYFRGQGVEQNPAEAFVWFQKAAEQGSPDGMFRLGYCYAKGVGTPRDLQQAVHWLKKAAAVGRSPAMACLGAMAWGGLGTPQDFAAAKEWFEKAMAAKGGNTWAPFMLGLMHENGQGMPQDLNRAEEFYRQSAAGGYYQAKIRCALLHADGKKAPDYQEDLKWLIRGAEAGNPGDQFVLGLAYLKGVGIKANQVDAFIWLSLAQEYQMKVARELCATLHTKLSQQELETAMQKIGELKKQFAQTGIILF